MNDMRGVKRCSSLGGRAVVRAVGDSEWGFRLQHDLLGLITGPQKSQVNGTELSVCLAEIVKIVADVGVVSLVWPAAQDLDGLIRDAQSRCCGRCAESRVMPWNSMEVLGPEVFSSDRGMPRSENVCMSVFSPWQGVRMVEWRWESRREDGARRGVCDCLARSSTELLKGNRRCWDCFSRMWGVLRSNRLPSSTLRRNTRSLSE